MSIGKYSLTFNLLKDRELGTRSGRGYIAYFAPRYFSTSAFSIFSLLENITIRLNAFNCPIT